MSGPFAFLDTPQKPASPFDFLNKSKEPEGVFSYLGNLTKNTLGVLANDTFNISGMTPLANALYGNSEQDRAQLRQIRANLVQAHANKGEAWDRVKEDLTPSKFFSKISELSETSSVGDMITGLPMALASTIGSPLEAGTGLALGKAGAPILSPEERASKIKETAAIAVSTAVGGMTRFALTKTIEKAAFGGVSAEVAGATLGQETNLGLKLLAKGPKIGQLGRDLLKGGVEAGVAGATFGAVANANTEHQLGGIITGLMFAPIGMAGEMLGTQIRGGDNIAKVKEAAGQLFLLRQLQYSPDKSLFELTKSLESIATSDDLAMAVAKGKMSAGDAHIIVPNVSEDVSVAAVKEGIDGGYYKAHRHANADGTYSVLFSNDARIAGPALDLAAPGDLKASAFKTFQQTGYVPNEVVSYKGKDYLFDGLSVSGLAFVKDPPFVLRDPVSGKRIADIPRTEISRNAAFNLDNGKVMIDSPLTLKGKLLSVNKNMNTAVSTAFKNGYIPQHDIINPYANENNAALTNVKTGQPIAFIGMRQSRGQQIIGNGKFYALTPEHLLNYTPSKYEGYSPEIIKGGASPFKLGTTTTAPGRETIPGIKDNNLSVNRLTFENPFVFNGKHYSLTKDIEKFYTKYSHISDTGLFKSGLSESGIQWGKILTEPEMKGIIEARALEQKPIGVPTSKFLQANDSPLLRDYKKMQEAFHKYDTGLINISDYNKIHEEFLSKYTQQQIMDAEYAAKPIAGKTHSESHYAIIDRIMSKALRRNGHDGFIYNSGGIHNAEVVDLTERGVFNRPEQTVPIEGKASNILDPTKFVDKLYDEFKPQIGTTEPFDEVFDRFTKMKGMLPEETANLRRSFEQRIHNEILDVLPPEEKPLFARFQKEIESKETQLFQNGTDNLRQSALHNNMYFDDKGAGVITLRDGVSNKELGTFHSVSDAQEFITNSGQTADRVNLDGNANIPPSAGGANNIPDNIGPLNPPPSGWLDRKYAEWGSRLSFATANPTLFKQWDILFKTELHAKVFNKVDAAAKMMDGKKSVFTLGRLKPIDKVLGKATQAEREHVFNWMETRSIAEHEKFGGQGGKSLSPMEMALGKQLVNVDLTNMYKYKNAMRSVDMDKPEGVAMDAELKKQFNITPNEVNALTLLSIAEKNQVQKLSIGASIHYARLLQNPELALTRAEYAKKFNLKSNHVQAGEMLDRYFNDLSDVAGISKDKLLFNYITHARLYENGSLPDALAKYALDKPTEDFYAEMNRTGELDTYERDPIRAALRYTNSLFNTLYLSPAINEAKAALKVELSKLPAGSGLKVERDATKYLNDVRHLPAEGDRYADAAINHLNGRLGVNVEKGITRKWVNGINEVFTVSAQGARVWAGIRDFYSNTTKYYHKWGALDTAKMLELGANADRGLMRESGVVESYTQLGLNSAVDEAASALTHAGNRFKATLDKTAHTAMTLSGQQAVNEMARNGAFLVTRNKVAKMLVDLHSGKFGEMTKPETFQKAYHELQLERYSAPVFQEFDRMIKANKTEEAANYLGNQHIQETFGNYANANHPSGWNNNFGRLVGKFGQWSINHRDYVVSLASRGTRNQRLASMGRLALTESAIAAAAVTFGVNLSNFYSLPGMYFKGGPAGDLFYTAYNAMFGKGMEQESAIRKVQQLLPYDQVNEKMKGSIVVPFSFALTDLVDGLDMASNGDVAGGLARSFGVRPMNERYQSSQWEETIGNVVGGR